MKVTAYKDPASGQLFESETLYKRFLAEQKREDAAEKRRQDARKAEAHARMTLVRELATRPQFAELATTMYTHALTTAARKRNKVPLKVKSVNVTDWRVDSSLNLSLTVEVQLDGQPRTTYQDTFVRLAPNEVLHPFRLSGVGNSDSKRGRFTYTYGLTANLKDLPKLLATMKAAAALQKEAEQHQGDVDNAVATAQAADAVIVGHRLACRDAVEVVEAARKAHADALQALTTLEAELRTKVAAKLPFKRAAALKRAEADAGIPSNPTDWTWRMAMAALRKPTATTA